MTHMLFGGAIVPMNTGDTNTAIDTETELKRLSPHVRVDWFSFDLDSAMISVGPVAREFHGFAPREEHVGIRRFIEAYDPACRRQLLELLEMLSGEGHPFHFTARLAVPKGAFVHGFIVPSDGAGQSRGDWNGTLLMSRHELRAHDRMPVRSETA